MLSRFFGSSCTLDISLDAGEDRKYGFLDLEKRTDKAPVYSNGDNVSGMASIHIRPGKKLEHHGVRIELVGKIEYAKDKFPSTEFSVAQQTLSNAASISQTTTYPFSFPALDKYIETYRGELFSIRYFLRLCVGKSYGNVQKHERDVIVQNVRLESDITDEIRLEVGVEDYLHLEFVWNKNKYHLRDCIRGRVNFFLVRIKIKQMLLDIVKRETIHISDKTVNETTTISKFEIMDGSPVKGESIPVRMYLSNLNLTPSYLKTLNIVSVRYFLNLVIIDEDGKRFFKQQEITLWRKKLG